MNNKLAIQENAIDVLRQDENMAQFKEILGERAPHYIATIAAMYASTSKIKDCTPESILIAALRGAADDLSFDPALAEAYMVGYNNKVTEEVDGKKVTRWERQAQYQYGYKGLMQLGIRTGQYTALGCSIVTNRMFRKLRDLLEASNNPGDAIIKFFSMIDFYQELHGGQVVGYIAYFRLVNGFTDFVYWDKARCLKHGLEYSPSAEGKGDKRQFKDGSFWLTNEDAACLKTVIRQLMLSGTAPKSKALRYAFEQEASFSRELERNSQRLALQPKSEHDPDGNDLWEEENREEAPPEPGIETIKKKCLAEAQRLKGLNPERYEDFETAEKETWTRKNWEGALSGIQKEIEKAQKKTKKEGETAIQEITHQWDLQNYHQEHRWNSLLKFFEAEDRAEFQASTPEKALESLDPTMLSSYLDYLLAKADTPEEDKKKKK
jgi:recombination protein RecT